MILWTSQTVITQKQKDLQSFISVLNELWIRYRRINMRGNGFCLSAPLFFLPQTHTVKMSVFVWAVSFGLTVIVNVWAGHTRSLLIGWFLLCLLMVWHSFVFRQTLFLLQTWPLWHSLIRHIHVINHIPVSSTKSTFCFIYNTNLSKLYYVASCT